ncbi:hypothetical protein AAHH80_33055, partial [Burkholderia pseudomallei]
MFVALLQVMLVLEGLVFIVYVLVEGFGLREMVGPEAGDGVLVAEVIAMVLSVVDRLFQVVDVSQRIV